MIFRLEKGVRFFSLNPTPILFSNIWNYFILAENGWTAQSEYHCIYKTVASNPRPGYLTERQAAGHILHFNWGSSQPGQLSQLSEMEWTWFLIRAPVDLTPSQAGDGWAGESWGKSCWDAPNVALRALRTSTIFLQFMHIFVITDWGHNRKNFN